MSKRADRSTPPADPHRIIEEQQRKIERLRQDLDRVQRDRDRLKRQNERLKQQLDAARRAGFHYAQTTLRRSRDRRGPPGDPRWVIAQSGRPEADN